MTLTCENFLGQNLEFVPQSDQIGRFLKVLGNTFAYKSSSRKIGAFWAIFEKINLCKNCCG